MKYRKKSRYEILLSFHLARTNTSFIPPQAGEPGAFTTTTPGFAQPPPHPPPSVTIESLVNQQQQLQEQIHQSEQNLAAQQLVC